VASGLASTGPVSQAWAPGGPAGWQGFLMGGRQ